MPSSDAMTCPGLQKGKNLDQLRQLCTQELLLLLEQSPRLDELLAQYGEGMASSFSEHLNALMKARSISVVRLSEQALFSRSFTYQLCSGVRAPGRDIVLRLAFVLELSVEETQRLLLLAQRGALYPKVRRDAVVIFALSHQLSLYDADDLLRSFGEVALL